MLLLLHGASSFVEHYLPVMREKTVIEQTRHTPSPGASTARKNGSVGPAQGYREAGMLDEIVIRDIKKECQKKMKIAFEELNEEVIYRVHDFDPKYESILQMCFYQNDGRGYIKKYPKNAKYIDNMQKRYYQNAQLMFDQLGYFADVPWKTGLENFCSMVQDSNIDWWLTGSCATCIRGIELNPHDIDIMINSKSVDDITELFKDYLIEPIVNTNGWLTKDFGVIFMDVRIDIASDPASILDDPEPVDCGPYALNNLEIIRWNGFEIRVPPLELQLNVNRRRGRIERVDRIEEFLKNES